MYIVCNIYVVIQFGFWFNLNMAVSVTNVNQKSTEI